MIAGIGRRPTVGDRVRWRLFNDHAGESLVTVRTLAATVRTRAPRKGANCTMIKRRCATLEPVRSLALRRLLVCAVASAASLPVAPAIAQQPGVTYDPDSPAGRQYGLPLADAPTPRASKQKGRAAQPRQDDVTLFGSGIKPSEGSTSRNAEDRGAPSSSGSRTPPPAAPSSPDASSKADRTPGAPAPEPRSSRTVAKAEGPSGTTVSLGTAALVLVVGLTAALGFRSADRRRRRAPS